MSSLKSSTFLFCVKNVGNKPENKPCLLNVLFVVYGS